MFSCLGSKSPKPVKILFLGSESVGKSSIIQVLMRKGLEEIEPTQGLQVRTLQIAHPKACYEFYDLSGADQEAWPILYSEVDLVVFVVDASADYRRMREVQRLFQEILDHPDLAMKEILVFANKVDRVGADRVKDISNKLRLMELDRVYLKCGSAFTLLGVDEILDWATLMTGFGASSRKSLRKSWLKVVEEDLTINGALWSPWEENLSNSIFSIMDLGGWRIFVVVVVINDAKSMVFSLLLFPLVTDYFQNVPFACWYS